MIVTEGEDVMAPDSGRLQRVRHSGARLRRAQARKNRRGTAAGDQTAAATVEASTPPA